MNSYIWRQNFTATFTDQEKTVRGKLAFKTKDITWLETSAPVILPISIHSNFHEGFQGDFKMNAFISTIKKHVKGKITVLLTEKAHVKTLSLKYSNNFERAFEECLKSAHMLAQRYESIFENCNVVYWHSYICQDPYFKKIVELLEDLYSSDLNFQKLLHEDAEISYENLHHRESYMNKSLYIEKCIEDLIEQCACLLVLVNKGYKFQFYPGKPCLSTEYVNRIFVPKDNRISWIDVFLSIEKKTITPHNLHM
ncbi:putative uncharacterized protein [Parachlamydia acanthamoebae UV-7]|jgi:hypothetical protein|uniref:Cyclodipeptide synthase n=2 Tax=Parachlamydia acanthamoebae TaxID=83552 RepID=F8L0F9_PARAV|nr:hypothetical protein [Parachlamydia acanthamoebae]EFB41666.1 hypothetical protein pah_c026o110 [Parachlamydia acanthamoebae str. Hall's coccus]KIA77608.1 hypothetical protein DB43_GD00390 [Parachlamydia acanthamoebae]CCB86695.1 putative uncharacterized protein [Parachlamydia acanthamoebae UV-7]